MDLSALKVGEPEALVDGIAAGLKTAASVEDAATLLCSELFERCRTPGGERALVLSRLYLSLAFRALDSGSAAFAREKFGLDPAPADLFLTLMGTRGDEPDWCDRRRSAGHRAIPLNRDTVTKVPMLSRCFQQIGFDLELVLRAEEGIHLDGVSSAFGLFHVEEARGSEFVPAQDGFVKPCGVRSAIGCGTMLPNGAVSVWIGFSRQPIPKGAAMPLIPLMPAFWQLAQPLYRRRALFAA